MHNDCHVLVQWLLHSGSLVTQNKNGLVSLFCKNLHQEDRVPGKERHNMKQHLNAKVREYLFIKKGVAKVKLIKHLAKP